MGKPEEVLEEIAALLRDEVVNYIKESVRIAADTFYSDRHNDNSVYGFQLWRNATNRLMEAANHGEISLRCIDGNDRRFKCLNRVLRFHSVDKKSLIPKNGLTAKENARRVASTTLPLFDDSIGLGEELVVGIVSSPRSGLERIVVGELVQSYLNKAYGYIIPPAEVFRAFVDVVGDGSEVSEEIIVPPVVTLENLPEEQSPQTEVDIQKTLKKNA